MRSLLFVPADSESKLAKAREIPADALVFDWEDSVLPENKALARRLTVELLSRCAPYRQAILIRLNKAGSETFQADCDALGGNLPDGVVLSKCDSTQEVLCLDEFLSNQNPERHCMIYPLIESPAGLLNAFIIAKSSNRVAGLAFGAEDFSAETGMHRTSEEIELLYARSSLVTVARAAGRDVYDSPCIEFQNQEKLRASAQRARNLGFTGKMAIHPSQVIPLNAIFSPSEAEVERARRLLEAVSDRGTAVAVFQGQMVDEAVLRQARCTLKLGTETQDAPES